MPAVPHVLYSSYSWQHWLSLVGQPGHSCLLCKEPVNLTADGLILWLTGKGRCSCCLLSPHFMCPWSWSTTLWWACCHRFCQSVHISTLKGRDVQNLTLWNISLSPPWHWHSTDWTIWKVLGHKSQSLLLAASSGALLTPLGRFHFNWPSGMTYFCALSIFKINPELTPK